MKPIHLSICLIGLTIFSACAPRQQADPLINTRKLVKEGHADLYNNGAFKVPHTQISLIPAGSSATEYGLELMGFRARQSFQLSLQNARDSIYIVADGTKKSFRVAKRIHQGTDKIATAITDRSRPNSKLLIYKSYPATKHIIGSSFELASETADSLYTAGDNISRNSLTAGKMISGVTTDITGATINQSWLAAKHLSQKSNLGALSNITYAGQSFVKGYAAIPAKFSQRSQAVTDAVSWQDFSAGLSNSNQWRGDKSQQLTDIILETGDNYSTDIKNSFHKAGDEFDNVKQTGFVLATLKATRWVLQGLLWDSIIKPTGKIGMASVGYLTVNTVAFPVMVVSREAFTTTELAVQVTWNSAVFAYDLVAPTVIAATASLFSAIELVGGNLGAGATAIAGTSAGSAGYLAGQVTAVSVQMGGYASGKTVQYIGVPLAAAGIAVTGTAAGVVTGSAAATTGGALFVAGETSAATTEVFGNLLAGTTAVTGTAISTVSGAGVGIYELTKAVVVPAGYELGGGMVLGYASASQLTAHSILAVSDASYLVLSLEGPRWVIYAVKGELNSGEELVPGTVLDLEAMQEAGEEFSYLPVSSDEMSRVIEHNPNDLPRLNSAATAAE